MRARDERPHGGGPRRYSVPVKSGFAHFDSAHRENFCAAVVLLTMDVDPDVATLLTRLVLGALGVPGSPRLLGFGREARLDSTDADNYSRVDLWLLFDAEPGPFYAFVEVKTHENWDAAHVARQVRDQAGRSVARSARRIHGSVLLAPERLCHRVRDVDPEVPFIAWQCLLREMQALPSSSALALHAIRHIEDQMDHPPGIERSMTVLQFEEATTTISCLRQFLMDCIADLKGSVHGEPLYMTPGDGRPRRGGGWAWHGLAVPFTLDDRRGRIGIYKYAEAPPGESEALEALWLEVYLGDGDQPIMFSNFAPATLAREQLDEIRTNLKRDWASVLPAATT
jgi:hypothetical protein